MSDALRDRIAEAICEELGWVHPKDKSDSRLAAQAVIDALQIEKETTALQDGTVVRRDYFIGWRPDDPEYKPF